MCGVEADSMGLDGGAGITDGSGGVAKEGSGAGKENEEVFSVPTT